MTKRVIQTLAVSGMLAALGVTGYNQNMKILQVSGNVWEETYEATVAEVMLAAESALESQAGENGAAGQEDDMFQIAPANIPAKPSEDNFFLTPEEMPVMGAVYSARTPYLVGIDPGHLGYTWERYINTGAVSVSGMPEYEWTLAIALPLAEELRDRGYNVFLLRTTNELKEYPYNNGQRANAANDMECDILVSIHWDSSESRENAGYHTIYKGKTSTASYRLASALSDSYGAAVEGAIEKRVNPASRDDLWELNVAKMPAAILECGFSSNEKDAAWLENEENYVIIVNAIADGIDDYFKGERERNR